MSDCRRQLEKALHKDVDLINLRRMSTVFQQEIIFSGRTIYCPAQYATDEFEMLTISFYQQLNRERKDILDDIRTTGRVLNV
jgi:uncharacterized protein